MELEKQDFTWKRRTAEFVLGFALGIIVGGNLIILWIVIGGLND